MTRQLHRKSRVLFVFAVTLLAGLKVSAGQVTIRDGDSLRLGDVRKGWKLND